MKGKQFITPDDWMLVVDECSTVEPHLPCDDWYTITTGDGVEISLHREEIVLLEKATRPA